MAAAFADITNQMSVHDRKDSVKSFNETHHKATKLRPPQLAIADLAALEASAMNPSAGVPMSPLTSTSTAMTPTTSNSMMQSIAQRRGYAQGQPLMAPQGQIATPTCAMELDAALSPIFPPTQTPTAAPMQSAWACPGAPLRPGHAANYHTITRCSTPMSGMSGPVVPLARTLSFSTNSTPSGTPMAGYRPLSGFPHPPLPSPLGFQAGIMRQFSFSQASTPLTPSPEGLAWGDVPSAPQKVMPTHNREGSMTPVPFSYQSPMW